MHELALAEAVVAAAIEAADREGLREIAEVSVKIGELQQIRLETFEFALNEVVPAGEPRVASTRFKLEIERARFRCRPCSRDFTLADAPIPGREEDSEAIHFVPELAHAFLRCPDCGSPDFEVAAGRGVAIDSLAGD